MTDNPETLMARRLEVEELYRRYGHDEENMKIADILGIAFFILAYMILVGFLVVEGVIR